MIKLGKIISEIKIVKNPSKNHKYYEEVNDWIEWDSNNYEIEEKDGGSAYGWVYGEGISGKYYSAGCSFIYEGGGSWEPDLNTLVDIEEEKVNEVKITSQKSLESQGYKFYSEINDWIYWYDKYSPPDPSWGDIPSEPGVMYGRNPAGKEYVANYDFGYDTPYDIEEV